MDLAIREGDRFEVNGKVRNVTKTAVSCLPRVRAHLIGIARACETVSYSHLRRALELPYAVNGMGWLLDVLTEDCRRRGEPSLAALVVTVGTGEVGVQYPGQATQERAAVYTRSTWTD